MWGDHHQIPLRLCLSLLVAQLRVESLVVPAWIGMINDGILFPNMHSVFGG